MTVKPSEVLREARAKVEHAWHQIDTPKAERHWDGPESVCMFTAIVSVTDDLDQTDTAASFLFAALGFSHEKWGSLKPLFGWNDTPGREKGEVLDAFDMAVKFAEESEALA